MDHIIIPGSSVEQSLERLSHVLARLRYANLKLKPSKCSLFSQSVTFLGHVVSHSGFSTDPVKIEAVQDWPIPASAKQVRSFLGLCSYYRKFIHCFADIARPLHKLTEKDSTFNLTPECKEAFQKLKTALTSAPILAYPRPEGQFTLNTDASGVAVGAVLSQLQDEEQVIEPILQQGIVETWRGSLHHQERAAGSRPGFETFPAVCLQADHSVKNRQRSSILDAKLE